MPESPGLYLRLSVPENLECFADLYEVADSTDRIDRALRAVNLPTGPAILRRPVEGTAPAGRAGPGAAQRPGRCCSSTSRPPGWTRSPPATSTS